jgi:endonuclease/exonuclease/phosphatase family metal-dependent hydrolase
MSHSLVQPPPRRLRGRRRSAVLVGSALLATTAAGLFAPSSNATEPVLRVGSYNVRAGVSTSTFSSAVHSMTSISDVAGFQEVNSRDKERVLGGLSGWDYYRPYRPPGHAGVGEQNAVIWNSSRFTYLSGRSVRIAPQVWVGSEKAPGYVNPNFVAVVHLRDKLTGRDMSLICVHLVPGAVINGLPTKGKPRLFGAFRTSVVNLRALAGRERSFGTVYVLGDFNVGWVADRRTHLPNLPYTQFWQNLSMRSMWGAQRPSGNRGSHAGSPALIDQVYAAEKASASTVYYSRKYSDHYPVVARYTLG